MNGKKFDLGPVPVGLEIETHQRAVTGFWVPPEEREYDYESWRDYGDALDFW